ncbi:hypothetical protein R1flu_010332 [Riccia fluitans]|uniref:Uncharacterized protein n=1 Tax=Riccia fluitans TaxID=41844 RepID=A0ABD1Z4U8_9MARC
MGNIFEALNNAGSKLDTSENPQSPTSANANVKEQDKRNDESSNSDDSASDESSDVSTSDDEQGDPKNEDPSAENDQDTEIGELAENKNQPGEINEMEVGMGVAEDVSPVKESEAGVGCLGLEDGYKSRE